MDGSTALGSATLSSGKASFKTTSLAGGSQAITAVYGGDGNFITSKSVALTQTVQQDATTTNLKSSANPSVFGQSVTFTATVKAASPGSGTPSGTVTFYDGSTTLGSATLGGTGTASFTTSSLSVGSHSIKVSYGGDADFKASTSAVLKQSVRASSSSSAAQLVDQALSALPDDDAPTVGSTVHDLALEQVSVRDRRPHRPLAFELTHMVSARSRTQPLPPLRFPRARPWPWRDIPAASSATAVQSRGPSQQHRQRCSGMLITNPPCALACHPQAVLTTLVLIQSNPLG